MVADYYWFLLLVGLCVCVCVCVCVCGVRLHTASVEEEVFSLEERLDLWIAFRLVSALLLQQPLLVSDDALLKPTHRLETQPLLQIRIHLGSFNLRSAR